MTSPSTADNAASTAFFAARDRLLDLAADPARARAEFTWPDVGPDFNWAHDVFDVIAAGNDATALWIAEADGTEIKRSFAEMKRRSDQVARTGCSRRAPARATSRC